MGASVDFARGMFGRVENVQAWFPGTHGQFAMRDRDWLERTFPLLKADAPRGIGHHPGREGTVWVRWVDGCWMVCHVCLPDWSRDRTIPAWALVAVPDRHFRSTPCLADLVDDVLAGAAMRGEWCSSRPGSRDTAWDDAALAALVEFFDVALVPAHPGGWYELPAACLDPAGWLALQAVLVAMRDVGVPLPCGVWAPEAPWAAPLASIPRSAYVFGGERAGSGSAGSRPVAHPSARGVEFRSFIRDLASAHRLVGSVAARAAASGGVGRTFASVAAAEVPLGLVDPGALHPSEWRDWAACIAATSGSAGEIAAAVDGLVARICGGDPAAIGPMLALAAHWAGVHAADPGYFERRLDGWLTSITCAGASS